MTKQRRQGLNGDNLGDVMRSAKNAGKLGTQQFETPLAVARQGHLDEKFYAVTPGGLFKDGDTYDAEKVKAAEVALRMGLSSPTS